MIGKKGRNQKKLWDYIIESDDSIHVSHQDYVKSPATAFLRYCTEANNAVGYCQKYFRTNKDGLASLQYISSALLPTIMGHFETYQRYFFAGLFELSHLINGFDVKAFFGEGKGIGKENIETKNLAGYRGLPATAGILLADNMSSGGWHDPEKVNKYFNSFKLDVSIYSINNCIDLKLLWQLRHSIVHTGGTITIPDAQKVDKLLKHRGKVVVFDNNFIPEVCKEFHPLIKGATERIYKGFEKNLITLATTQEKERLKELCLVESNSPSLFK